MDIGFGSLDGLCRKASLRFLSQARFCLPKYHRSVGRFRAHVPGAQENSCPRFFISTKRGGELTYRKPQKRDSPTLKEF